MNEWQNELFTLEYQARRREILRARADREGILQAILSTADEAARQDERGAYDPRPEAAVQPAAPLTPRGKVERDLRARGVIR